MADRFDLLDDLLKFSLQLLFFLRQFGEMRLTRFEFLSKFGQFGFMLLNARSQVVKRDRRNVCHGGVTLGREGWLNKRHNVTLLIASKKTSKTGEEGEESKPGRATVIGGKVYTDSQSSRYYVRNGLKFHLIAVDERWVRVSTEKRIHTFVTGKPP